MFYKGDGKVSLTRHFLHLKKIIFDEHVNAIGSYSEGDISDIYFNDFSIILYTYIIYVCTYDIWCHPDAYPHPAIILQKSCLDK